MKTTFELTLHLGETVQAFSAAEGVLVIGRDPSCEVRIDSEDVALHQATLSLEGTKIQVEDLAGNHGTLVNGYDISGRVEVECPASVQVGQAVLVIQVKDGEAEVEESLLAPTVALLKPGEGDPPPKGNDSLSGKSFVPGPEQNSMLGAGPRSASVQVQYALGSEIARGGMGRIYKGHDPLLKREVAIKISSAGGSGDPRFTREAEVLGNLPHPNIVPIHAIGEDEDGFPFYSMKLVKGQTLQAIIKSLREGDKDARQHYTRERRLTIFLKICDAIAFAHSKGVLHRDLKPENVMVGEFGEVLVMDWGLAKRMGDNESPSEGSSAPALEPSPSAGDFGATLDGEVLGTPQYMSPEQAQGRLTTLDQRSDIYSLGAILYSILTLRPPVEGETLDELLTKVRSGQITSMATKRGWAAQGKSAPGAPTEMGAEVPEALRAVTRQAMALEREQRYQSVAEFAADIESYLNGFATQAEHAGLVRQLLLLVRRHKSITALLALIFFGAAAFTLKLVASEREAQANARIAEENERNAKANEKKASEERQHARLKAAEANIALVEAAERDFDGEEIQRTLAEVPKDLRDQKWEYLNSKLEGADMSAEARDGVGWNALIPHPQKPGVLVTMQSNGWIRTVDLKKQGGAIENLLKLDPNNLTDVFEISRDASKAAFVRQQRDKGAVKNSTVELVQFPSGKKIVDIKLPGSGAFSINFSPDGNSVLFLYKTLGENVQHCELRNMQGELVWEHGNQGATWAEFSEDGKKIRGLSEKSGLFELDSKTGEPLHPSTKIPWAGTAGQAGSGKLSVHIAPSADWSSVVTYSEGGGKFLRRFETATGKVLFENRCLSVTSIAALPEANLIVTLSQRSDRCVVLQYWHRETGLLIKSSPLVGNMKGGWRLAVHPKTGDVAVINGQKLRAWNFQTSKSVKSFSAQPRSFEFAGDPWRIVRMSGSGQDCAFEVLDTRTPDFVKKPLASFKDPKLYNAKIASNKNGAVFAVNNYGTTRVFRRAGTNFTEGYSGNGIPNIGSHWALNEDGSRLWTGAGIYDTASGKELCKMDRTGVDSLPTGAGLSDWIDSKTVVEIALVKADWPGAPEDALERAILLWDAQTGQRLLRMDAPDANGLCISPDGKQICEAGNDMRLRLRNSKTLGVTREFRAHDGAISDVEWHPKLPLLVSSSEDLTVRIWNIKDSHLVEELHGIANQQQQRPERIAISPDGSLLALCAAGRGVELFEPVAFKPKTSAPAPVPVTGAQGKSNPASGTPPHAPNPQKQNPAPAQAPSQPPPANAGPGSGQRSPSASGNSPVR